MLVNYISRRARGEVISQISINKQKNYGSHTQDENETKYSQMLTV